MRSLKWLLIVLFIAETMGVSSPAYAWTHVGHELVADIAWSRMTPQARSQAMRLLESGDDVPNAACQTRTFRQGATWLDCIRSNSSLSPDVAKQALVYHADRDALCPVLRTHCKDHHCATDTLEQAIAQVSDKNEPLATRRIALKIIMHLVGDLHQPLHEATASDGNGNLTTVLVKPNAQPMGLHGYWDNVISHRVRTRMDDVRRIIDAHGAEMERGTIKEWNQETREQAKDIVYGALPGVRDICLLGKNTPPILLDRHYVDDATTLGELKIAQAGVRLAVILNRVL
jgi:hypothetical protein